MHALARRVQLPRPEPGRPERHSQLDQPARPRVPVRSEGVRQVPGWRRSPGAGAASEKVALLNLAKCMRAHGLPNFPDPTTSPPPAPPPGSHTGNAIGIGGVYLVFPPQSPALKRAEGTAGSGSPDAHRPTASPASRVGLVGAATGEADTLPQPLAFGATCRRLAALPQWTRTTRLAAFGGRLHRPDDPQAVRVTPTSPAALLLP